MGETKFLLSLLFLPVIPSFVVVLVSYGPAGVARDQPTRLAGGRV